MKPVINLKLGALGVALLFAVGASSALTLGRARSMVLVGQPLELIIPVQFGADEVGSVPCFDADVFYGDIRQDRSRVALSTLPTASSQAVNVRVLSQAAIDEPVVTVTFRAGCERKISRSYVLLADLVTGLELPSVLSLDVTRDAPVRAASGKRQVNQSLSAEAAAVSSPRTASSVVRLAPKKSAQSANASVVARPQALKPGAQPNTLQRARLKLTPLELTAERDPVLRSSDLLIGLPIEDLQKRALAAATWRALNASPQEVLQLDERVLSMDKDVKDLGDLTKKNQQSLLDLAGRLEIAQGQRYNNPLVYGLAAGLVACLIALAFMLWRLRTRNADAAPWWRDESVMDESVAPQVDPVVAVVGSLPPSTPARLQDRPQEPLEQFASVDIDLAAGASDFGRISNIDSELSLQPKPAVSSRNVSAVAANHHRDFSHSVNATLRAINTQEMLDVRQQAEFFMTLGQHEEAIALLEESIHESDESNPLVYLDLLKVLHALGRKDDYERYRDAFNELFSGRIPAYAYFFQPSHGLEDYVDVCQHIAGLWPSEDAQDYIEQCLVRSDDALLVQEFDLEAFRDLLTLHGVLRRLVSSSDSGLVPFSTYKSQALSTNEPASGVTRAPNTFTPEQTMPIYPSLETVKSVDLDLTEHASNLLELGDVDSSLVSLQADIKR